MSDQSFNECLDRLQKILGKSVALNSLQEVQGGDEQNEDETSSTMNRSDQEETENLPSTTSEMSPLAQEILAKLPAGAAEAAFDCSKFQVDEPAAVEIEFCPWHLVVSYPDRLIGKTNRPLARPFFNRITEGRVWDFFYIHHPQRPMDRPHLMVPSAQFQAFLNTVNTALDIALTFPEGLNREKFCMSFREGMPRPRYLKRSRDEKKLQIEFWPQLRADDVMAFRGAPPNVQDDWLVNFKPVTGGADKERKDAEKAAKRARVLQECKQMVRDAQCFLHLEGAKDGPDVVFIAVDVEALERPPNPVSEIGFAVLDTRDIRNVPAGPCGKDWWPMIQAHHLRTDEYSGMRNHEFIKGCPGAFDFGKSSFPPEAELEEAIMSILEPFIQASRDIVLIGHDIQQDIKYLSSLGIELLNEVKVFRQLDSQDMHRGWRELPSGRRLEVVLGDLHIMNKHLHNAGNDAVYTLRAVIGVAMEEIRQRQAVECGDEYAPALWAE